LAFFIGASGRTQTRTIQRPVAMNLTSAAKALLKQNPREFITRYGLRYIHSITYGGSFLGSVTLNSRETASDRDIQAFASFSVNKGLFSAGGSTEFQNTVAQTNTSVSTFINAQWVGGSDIGQDYRNPETLNNMFTDWDRSWRTNPAPLTIATRRWVDSADIQEVVNTMSAADRELFNSPDISQAIQREISDENAKVSLTDTSVRQALTWGEIQDDQATQSCLNNVRRDITAKLMHIDLLDEPAVLMIQQQYLGGDYSWFEAGRLHDRYMDCVRDVEPTDAPTEEPGPSDTLLVGQRLQQGELLVSSNGIARAGLQGDGNFVIYVNRGPETAPRWEALWASNTVGAQGISLVLQHDGNLVLYDHGGSPRWAAGIRSGAARTIMQNDCNLVTYSGDGRALWATGTNPC